MAHANAHNSPGSPSTFAASQQESIKVYQHTKKKNAATPSARALFN